MNIRLAWIEPTTRKPLPTTGALAQGLRYEAMCHRILEATAAKFQSEYSRNVTIAYMLEGGSGTKYAELDGLLLHPQGVILLEYKRRMHTEGISKVWHLYKPLVEKMWPRQTVTYVMICGNRDETLIPSPIPWLQIAPQLFDPLELRTNCLHFMVIPE